MIDSSVQGSGYRFSLNRVDESGNEEQVGTFATFSEGWAEGQHRTHSEPEAAFRLYEGKRSVARFGFHRLQQRDVTANLDAMMMVGEL